jgi:DNA-binding IclR family transcriptional regulator
MYKEEPDTGGPLFSTKQGKRMPAEFTVLGKSIHAGMGDDAVRALFEASSWRRLTDKGASCLDDLLADLRLMRERGLAVDEEESGTGVMCLGASVLDHNGTPCGAASRSFIKAKYSWGEIPEPAKSVMECATRVSAQLGHVS